MQRGGFSILELVIALALFLLVLTMLGAYASFSLVNLARSQSFIEAEALNQEGRSLVELVARRDWGGLNTSLNALHYDLGQWNLVSGAAEQIGVENKLAGKIKIKISEMTISRKFRIDFAGNLGIRA
jgi:type II secretory pathway pseudopilin PulG